jgi:peroxiredoxin
MKKLLPALASRCALASCSPAATSCRAAAAAFQNTDVTGLDYAKGFALTDHTGKPRTLADFKGKVVVVFFGYTQCPDVCPTTMAEMAAVMQELGPQADQVQVLFVTLDPERDTQELLASTCRPSTSASSACTARRNRRRRRPRNSRCSTRRCRARTRAATRSTTRPAAMSSTATAGCACSSATARAPIPDRATTSYT